MASSNLSKRLDKLERGIHALLEKKENKPLFVSEGEPATEGTTVIVMNWVEAQPQEDALEDIGSGNTEQRKTPLTLPPLGSAAEREKRWESHLRAIDARAERYQGEDGGGLSEIGRSYRDHGVI